MANISAPFGLRPVNRDGRFYTGAITKYYIPSSDNTALYVGDPVIHVGTANTTVVKSGTEEHAIGTLTTIQKATMGATNKITGVIVGFEADPNDRATSYRKASTERVALVCDAAEALFEVQADGVVGAASVGLNAVLTAGAGGSTVTGLSSVQLDSGTTTAPAADATYQVTIEGVSKQDRRNDMSVTKPVLIVRINLPTKAPGIVGV